MITIIVAIASNGAIGKDNDLLWHIPDDLKRFKAITTGHTVIMGRRTWESLHRRPLPNRRNIVITDVRGEAFAGCDMAYSIEEALGLCRNGGEHFIIGGASVYRQFLPHANRLLLTRVHKDFEGDVFFPEIDYSQWKLVETEDFPPSGENDFSYTNETWVRLP